MIIDSKQGDIEVVGDVKEFKTSIDPKNLEFITTLLSSNLYSDPEQSFIREIVSNAWDSHVEAGTTDTPVIIKFDYSSNNNSITIRDYGTGLSPERFQNIFCMIGSSTKRESNDFIGGFGIGRFAALACSNAVYITSYYEGIAYYYVMVKSGNTITTNLLAEKPTTEKNGVAVSIQNIKNITPYKKALQYIVFFPNIYVEGLYNNNINNIKLRKFNNFAAASNIDCTINSKILLGNVLYRCDSHHLNHNAKQFLDNISYTNIVIKFDVGELEITPNRENIIYNVSTIKKIEDRIKAAKEEIENNIRSLINKDYDDIKEIHNITKYYQYYEPVSNSINDNKGYKFAALDLIPIIFKGIDIKEDVENINKLYQLTIPNYKGIAEGNSIYIKKPSYKGTKNIKIASDKILILNKEARLNKITQEYIKENYNYYGIMTDITKEKFIEWVKLFSYIDLNTKNSDFILENIYDSLVTKAVKLDLKSNTDYLEFKKSFSTKGKTILNKKRDIILYEQVSSSYRHCRKFKDLETAIKFMKGLKKGIILVSMKEDTDLYQAIAIFKNYVLIKARKDIVEDLKKLNCNFLVDIEWLLKKDPMLTIINTLVKHFPVITREQLMFLEFTVPKDLFIEFKRIYNIYSELRVNQRYKSIIYTNNFGIDSYTEYLCNKLEYYWEGYLTAMQLYESSNYSRYDKLIIATVIMKMKLYRISTTAYSEIKNNKILQILCRKS